VLSARAVVGVVDGVVAVIAVRVNCGWLAGVAGQRVRASIRGCRVVGGVTGRDLATGLNRLVEGVDCRRELGIVSAIGPSAIGANVIGVGAMTSW
jgi:hypothetical protein